MERIPKTTIKTIVEKETPYGPIVKFVREESSDKIDVAVQDHEKEAEYDVETIVEKETPYGPIIKRVRKHPQVDQTVTQKNSVEIIEQDPTTSEDRESTLREYLEEKFGQFRTELETRAHSLTEGQRKQLRAVLLAIGVAVVPVKYMTSHETDVDPDQAVTHVSEVSSQEDQSWPMMVSVQESPRNVSPENKEVNFIEDFEENIKQYEKLLQEMAKLSNESGPVDVAEVERRSVESEEQIEPHDAFGKEVAKFSASLNEQDIDFMRQNAKQRVVGAERFDRIRYVKEAIEFKEWNKEKKIGVPPVVQEELRRVLPGLCAQESKFHNGLESRSGAKGIWQFMPNTLAGYKGTPKDLLSFKRQVEIAGEFLSDLYVQINHHIGEQGMEKLRSRFEDEETFQREFIVPLMINAYNTGAKGISDEVERYLKRTPIHRMPKGRDLFVDIIKKSNLNEEQSQYVFKSYRWLNIKELGSNRG